MGVQGYLSLYTILLGWQVYDGLWTIMTQTGFILLPFAFIAVRCFLGPFLSMGAKDAGVVGARRFVIHLFGAIFILIFAGAPIVVLAPEVLHFKPRCSKTAQVATPGNTGTTYDKIMRVPQSVKVPVLWYLVLAISNGLTDQAETILSCPTTDLRALQNRLNLAALKDTQLKAETSQFYNDCYLPAYNKFIAGGKSSGQQQQIKDALKKYGQDDVSWIGSEIFQRVPGFYDSYYSSAPIKGFPYQGNNPHDQIQGQTETTTGVPSCLNWWQEPTIGLRDRLFGQFSQDLKAQLAEIDYKYLAPKLVEDAAIRAMLSKSTGGGVISKGYSSEEDYRKGTDNFLGKWAAKVYTDKLALEEYPKIHILINMLPILQATILFAVIMLLALALPLSAYSVEFCVTAAIFMFSITFCSFLWHAITWFDNFLLQALYSATDIGIYNDPVRFVKNIAETALNPQKNLVDITISIMYIFIPGIWITMTTWAGMKIGGFVSGFAETKQQGGTVGGHSVKGAFGVGRGFKKFWWGG